MALTGFRYPKVSKLTIDPSTEAETLAAGKVLAKGVKSEVTIRTNKQVFYADDGAAESVNMFVGGDGRLTVDDITEEMLAEMAGANYSAAGATVPNEATYNGDDTPPFYRLGYIGRKLVRNAVHYVVTVYAKVQFDVPSQALETQGENMTLTGVEIPFTIYRNVDGNWRWKKSFTGATALADAESYLNSKVSIT